MRNRVPKRLAVSPPSAVLSGVHRVVGEARGSELLAGLRPGVRCVWSRWVVEDHYRRKTRRGTDTEGWEIVHRGEFSPRFTVIAEGAAVVIDPVDVEVDEAWTEVRTVDREVLDFDFRGLRRRTIGASGLRRITERYVPAGALVDVTGTVVDDTGSRPVLGTEGRRRITISPAAETPADRATGGRLAARRADEAWGRLLEALSRYDEQVRIVAGCVAAELGRELTVPPMPAIDPTGPSAVTVDQASEAWRNRCELAEKLLAVADVRPGVYRADTLAPAHGELEHLERQVVRIRAALNEAIPDAMFSPGELPTPVVRRRERRQPSP